MTKIKKCKKEKKKKSNHAAAINYSIASSARVEQGFVEGSVEEANAEGSRKEENKEISEKASAMEEQNRCFSEKDIAFDESFLQEVKHVQKINDLTLSFEDKSEVEENFVLKTDEADLKINDSFKPSADDLEKNAEGSSKEAGKKDITEKVYAMVEENRCIGNIDGAFEKILQRVKHANKINDSTVSFENKSEVEKKLGLKIGEMDLTTNDSVKPIASGMGTTRLAKIEGGASNEIFLKGKVNDSIASLKDTEKNERLGEDLEKDMSEVEKSSEAKINDDSKPFVVDPEKSEDLAEDFSQFETKIKERRLDWAEDFSQFETKIKERRSDWAEDFSQFETKIKDRRSELAFEEKEKILPCNLHETLVPASENRCIEEKDGAFTENFTEDVKQENVNQSISLFEDIEIEKIIAYLKPFLDDIKIKILAKIGDLEEKFVRLEKKMIEMEKCFELKAGKLNSLIKDQSMFFACELESIKLLLKNRGVKSENEKMEME